MCLKCDSTVSDTKLYYSSKPHITASATATAQSWMRTTPASWCQPSEYSCCRDPVSRLLPACHNRPVLKEIYPWSISCCTHYQRVRHWSAVSRIRTSVPRRRGNKALLLALHDKDRSFIVKSGTLPLELYRVWVHLRVGHWYLLPQSFWILSKSRTLILVATTILDTL